MSTLRNIERYWKGRKGDVTLVQTDTDQWHVIQHYPNGLIDDYTSIVEVTGDAEVLAVYGTDTSHPYTFNDDDDIWERIDGKRLPKRPDHFVIEITGNAIPAGRIYCGDTPDDARQEVIDNFLDELTLTLKSFNAGVKMLNAATVGSKQLWRGYTFTLTTCNCAGHDQTDFLD